MSRKVAELAVTLMQEDSAKWVSHLWDTYNNQRAGKIAEWEELRNFIFATDTSHTTAGNLPWKNSTTVPKLCQIRDNLHSNYISSLFPNDNWLTWNGYSKDDSKKEIAKAIQAYMGNKCREGHFRTEASKLLYDYIDYGNSFCTVTFESNSKETAEGESLIGYVGPKVKRISPYDIVFNPLASSFQESFKIIRSVHTLGELKRLAATNPDSAFWSAAIERRERLRHTLGGYTKEDFSKAAAYSVDGFGNLYEYYQGDYVEVLEFYGDYHDSSTGELHTDKVLTIVDRSICVRNEDIPSWLGHAPIYHVGWRFRSDNLWAMGPLDNLVGMQYRIDHLENLRADAMDLLVNPPLKIKGEVEEFAWGPNAEIHLDADGDVGEVAKNMQGIIAAENSIAAYEQRMELYAGAPRDAMGIRTPGEKTAFEVQQLQTAAGRIFQEKITTFEIELLEPALNAMLETARRNMQGADIVRVMNDDLGVTQFLSVTKADITASGVLRPMGARHFAKQAQDLQNLVGVFSSPLASFLGPHTSAKGLMKLIDDTLGLSGYSVFKPHAALYEQQETQTLANQIQEDLAVTAAMPTEGQI